QQERLRVEERGREEVVPPAEVLGRGGASGRLGGVRHGAGEQTARHGPNPVRGSRNIAKAGRWGQPRVTGSDPAEKRPWGYRGRFSEASLIGALLTPDSCLPTPGKMTTCPRTTKLC